MLFFSKMDIIDFVLLNWAKQVDLKRFIIMSKRVVFNGIEILTSEDDISAKSFFDFAEEVIELLEMSLDKTDENFHLSINTEFFSNRKPQHRIYVNGLKNQATRAKLLKILQRSNSLLSGHAVGTASVNLALEDV